MNWLEQWLASPPTIPPFSFLFIYYLTFIYLFLLSFFAIKSKLHEIEHSWKWDDGGR